MVPSLLRRKTTHGQNRKSPAIVAAALSEHIAAAFIASATALAIAMALTLVGVLTGNVDR